MLQIALDSPSCSSYILLKHFLLNLLFLFCNFVQFLSIHVTGSRKRDHFADLLESRYRRLNSNNYNKTFFADLSFLLANGSRIFPLPLYQILSFVLFSK